MPGRDRFTYKSYTNSIYNTDKIDEAWTDSPIRLTQTLSTIQTKYARHWYIHLQELYKLYLQHIQDMPGRDRFMYKSYTISIYNRDKICQTGIDSPTWLRKTLSTIQQYRPAMDSFTYKSYTNSIYKYRSHTHQQLYCIKKETPIPLKRGRKDLGTLGVLDH